MCSYIKRDCKTFVVYATTNSMVRTYYFILNCSTFAEIENAVPQILETKNNKKRITLEHKKQLLVYKNTQQLFNDIDTLFATTKNNDVIIICLLLGSSVNNPLETYNICFHQINNQVDLSHNEIDKITRGILRSLIMSGSEIFVSTIRKMILFFETYFEKDFVNCIS